MNDLQKPLVSIITLTYKNFTNLFKTIDSVLNQNYPNIEYIISDDGSDSFPYDEVCSYINNHSNIKCIVLQNEYNVGTVKNINAAYKIAQGEYYINLSCGDVFYSSNVITDIINRFNQTKSDVLVTSRIAYKDDFIPEFFLPHYFDRRRIENWNSCERQYIAFVTSSFLNMASGSAMHFSKKAIETLGYFDERYRLWEDGPFIEKYLRKNCISTAYDIISIWYELGGVSTGDTNSLLYKDTLLFNSTDRLYKYNELTWWNKAKITYRNRSLDSKNRNERILLKIKMFPIFFYFFSQYLRNRVNSVLDREILKRMKV